MRLTVIPFDNLIIKDGVSEHIADDAFWALYSGVHAIQIDTNGVSLKEIPKSPPELVSDDEINMLSAKYDEAKSIREANELQQYNAFINSWDRVREERKQFLNQTDKFMLEDYPITQEKKYEYKLYRSAMRNITITYSNIEPKNILIQESGNVIVNNELVIIKPIE